MKYINVLCKLQGVYEVIKSQIKQDRSLSILVPSPTALCFVLFISE